MRQQPISWHVRSSRRCKRIFSTIVMSLGRMLGVSCYFVGIVVRSRFLCSLGLPSVAEQSFRRQNYASAHARAMELLRLAEANPQEWDYGNAVHHAHLMLGRVALVRGDINKAESELLAAAAVPGSPQLASFGPNMQLALELLQHGRKDCVLKYFALCEKFWDSGTAKLRAWADDVKNGRPPVFGANLFY